MHVGKLCHLCQRLLVNSSWYVGGGTWEQTANMGWTEKVTGILHTGEGTETAEWLSRSHPTPSVPANPVERHIASSTQEHPHVHFPLSPQVGTALLSSILID